MDDETKNGQNNETNPPANKQALARVPVAKLPTDQVNKPSAVEDAATAKEE